MNESTKPSTKQKVKRTLLVAAIVVLLLLLICLLGRCCRSIESADNPAENNQEVSFSDKEEKPSENENDSDGEANQERSPDEQTPEPPAEESEGNLPAEPEPPENHDEMDSIDDEPDVPKEPVQDEPAASHEHQYTSVITEPTCIEPGYTTRTCACGYSYQIQVKPAIDHQWSTWETTKEPTTEAEGKKTRICSSCQISEHQPIEKLPDEEPTEPVGCQHEWKTKYHAEVGHYGDYYNVCKCGFRFNHTSEWSAHLDNFSGEELILEHTSWGSARDYIVDTPAYYDWHCTKCGEVRDVEPE